MCGIAGIFNFEEPRLISPEQIERMNAALAHRGPDESGIYVDDWVGLGNTRLSIIDLAAGSQPIHNEDRSLWIVYNGEIFNHPELRKSLLTRGHQFYTSTDTEVILHLFEDEGTECVHSLNGQFALAIWDARKQKLFLARDRLGIRPLHYAVIRTSIIFASEIKAIMSLDDVPREIDPVAVDQIFTFWTTLPGRTAFRGINELPPGHFLIASPERMMTRRYWSIPFHPPQEHLDWSVDKIADTARTLLTDAVRIRLRADVPVGCYLSGGLDSSAVTTLVVRNFNANAKTFGVRFQRDGFDEGTHQEMMVSFLNADHRSLMATDATIGMNFPDTIWHCEKPLVRTAPVPLFLLSGLVHGDGMKVVLTGEGADEVFAGYNIFREAKIRHFWAKRPDSRMRPALVQKLYPYVFKDARSNRMLQQFFRRGIEDTDDPFYSHRIRWNTTSRIKNYFSPDIRNAVDPAQTPAELEQMLPQNYGAWDLLSRAQYVEMAIFLSNYLLSSQGDRVAMAHALEIRLPYLDYRLVEFMGRVPSHLKIRGLVEKYILKRSMHDLLPEQVVNRPKHPYRAPIAQALCNGVSAGMTRDLVSTRSVEKAGLFDPHKTRMLFNKLAHTTNAGEVDSMALAGIVSTQLLVRQFIDREDPAMPSTFPASKKITIYDRRTLPT